MTFDGVSISNLPSSNGFVFTVSLKDASTKDPICGFWNATSISWESSGCALISRVNASITCRCNHLTSFGVLFDTSTGADNAIPAADEKALSILTYIGCSMSIVGCFLTILTFVAIPRLRTVPTILVMNLCVALILVNMVYVIGIDKTSSTAGCKFVAILLQFGLLSAFSWMGLVGYNVWRNVVVVKMGDNPSKLSWKHYAFGWGLPAVFVIVCIIVDAGAKGSIDYGDDKRCVCREERDVGFKSVS
eukprot:Opistho-2@9258